MAEKLFIDVFDQLSYKPYIFTNGTDRHKTCIPACFGLLSMLVTLSLAIYFLQETLSRRTPLVFHNEKEDLYPIFNLSSWPISVGLSDGSKRVYDPSIFSIKVFFMKYGRILTEDNKLIDDNKFTDLPLEKCNNTDFERLNSSALDNTLCLNPLKHNLTISGIYGDQGMGYTYLNVFLNRCVNNTSIVCKPAQEIENYLKNVFFIFGTPMFNLNHNNVSDPFVFSYKTFNLPMSSTMFKRYYLRLRNVIYDTDVGFVFEQRSIKNNFIFSDQEVSIDLKVGAFLNPSALGQITFQTASVSLYYNRSYSKLQSVIANSGGALNAVYTTGIILMYFLTKKDYFISLSNKCFSFEENVLQDIKDIKKIDDVFKDPSVLKIEKPNYFDLNICEKLFPNELCMCSEKVKKYTVAEELIMEKLSYKEILDNMMKIENLIEVLFNEEQITNFKSIKKRVVGIRKDESVHHVNNEIIKRFKTGIKISSDIININSRNLINIPYQSSSNSRIKNENDKSNIKLN